MRLFIDRFDSPLGPLDIGVDAEDQVQRIWFSTGEGVPPVDTMRYTLVREPAACREVIAQLKEYFAGGRKAFELQLKLEGTRFQRGVWTALLEVPWGRTISYRELAECIGNPHAARAVGGAVGANPLPILVPCHRVLAVRGRIGGYSGGLEKKRFLLEIEGICWKE